MGVIDVRDLPGPLTFHTPPADRGQMVEVGYAGLYDGRVLRRTHDRSDRSTAYAVGEIDWDREEDEDSPPGLNEEPAVIEWKRCQIRTRAGVEGDAE